MVARRDFFAKCEHWRSRKSSLPVGVLANVYKGCVRSEFSSILRHQFFSQPNNLCLMLNIDWLNPNNETLYSAGVITKQSSTL